MSADTNPSRYVWRVHPNYGGLVSFTAIEVGPGFDEIDDWWFAVPDTASVVAWGIGPSDGGTPDYLNKPTKIRGGVGGINHTRVTWFGASAKLSPGVSAYVVFFDEPPDFVAFCNRHESFGHMNQLEIYPLNAFKEWATVVDT